MVEEPEGDGGRAGQVDAAAFLRLSEALRVSFTEVTESGLAAEEAARWQRRLIAITNTAKRDLPRALAQMERFRADWQHGRR